MYRQAERVAAVALFGVDSLGRHLDSLTPSALPAAFHGTNCNSLVAAKEGRRVAGPKACAGEARLAVAVAAGSLLAAGCV